MSARLQYEVAIVTGSASGSGAVITRLFAAQGARVVGLDRNPSFAGRDGVRHLVAEVTRPDDTTAVMRQTLEAHGRIDVLVNNASTDVFSLSPSDANRDRCDGGCSQLFHE